VSRERARRGGWTVWLDRARWRESWWQEVLGAVDGRGEALAVSRHALTVVLRLPADGSPLRAYAKIYRASGGVGAFKDLWRDSKPVRALRAGSRLAADGFCVAPVLAAGEERRLRLFRRGFLVTEEVPWPTAVRLAGELASEPGRRRRVAKALGAEVGRLHRSGWVHGDLVVTNVLVDEGPPPRFCFLDHDRTRHGPALGARRQRRRNLIQLNRLPLRGVTHSDRLRAFVGYAEALGWEKTRWRREARWLARATSARRRELERIAARKARRGAQSAEDIENR
jgi:hypothetical protein